MIVFCRVWIFHLIFFLLLNIKKRKETRERILSAGYMQTVKTLACLPNHLISFQFLMWYVVQQTVAINHILYSKISLHPFPALSIPFHMNSTAESMRTSFFSPYMVLLTAQSNISCQISTRDQINIKDVYRSSNESYMKFDNFNFQIPFFNFNFKYYFFKSLNSYPKNLLMVDGYRL